MSSLSRIEYTPDLTEQVYERLLHAICNGELAREHCERAGQHIVAQLTRHVRHAS